MFIGHPYIFICEVFVQFSFSFLKIRLFVLMLWHANSLCIKDQGLTDFSLKGQSEYFRHYGPQDSVATIKLSLVSWEQPHIRHKWISLTMSQQIFIYRNRWQGRQGLVLIILVLHRSCLSDICFASIFFLLVGCSSIFLIVSYVCR